LAAAERSSSASASSEPLEELPRRNNADVEPSLGRTEVTRVPGDQRVDGRRHGDFEEWQIIRIGKRQRKRNADNVFGVVQHPEECLDVGGIELQFRTPHYVAILGDDASVDHQLEVSGKTKVNELRGDARLGQ
jgi:hypothetical protein